MFSIADVLFKVGITLEEVVIYASLVKVFSIPGGVNVIVFSIKLDDVPSVVLSLRLTCYNSAVDSKFQG